MLKNSLKFILFFAVSIFTVRCFSLPAKAATLFSGSAYQNVTVGQRFSVDWFLDTENQSLNLVNLKLRFDPAVLEAQDLDQSGSIFSVVIDKPVFDNKTGTISATLGIPNGLNATAAKVFRTEFKALKSGPAQIVLDPDSQALINDPSGTKANLKFNPVQFVIGPEAVDLTKISSTTDPDQNIWYKNRNVKISFQPQPGKVYSYSFSSNLEIYPPDQPTDQTEFNFNNLPDGVYYFKLNYKTGPATWHEAGIYRVQIDNTIPDPFPLRFADFKNLPKNTRFVIFNTVDKTSGISHYNVKVGLWKTYKNAVSPVQINRPLIGNNVTVEAVDNAGNSRFEELSYPGLLTVNQAIITFALLFVILLAIFLYLKSKSKQIG